MNDIFVGIHFAALIYLYFPSFLFSLNVLLYSASFHRVIGEDVRGKVVLFLYLVFMEVTFSNLCPSGSQ